MEGTNAPMVWDGSEIILTPVDEGIDSHLAKQHERGIGKLSPAAAAAVAAASGHPRTRGSGKTEEAAVAEVRGRSPAVRAARGAISAERQGVAGSGKVSIKGSGKDKGRGTGSTSAERQGVAGSGMASIKGSGKDTGRGSVNGSSKGTKIVRPAGPAAVDPPGFLSRSEVLPVFESSAQSSLPLGSSNSRLPLVRTRLGNTAAGSTSAAGGVGVGVGVGVDRLGLGLSTGYPPASSGTAHGFMLRKDAAGGISNNDGSSWEGRGREEGGERGWGSMSRQGPELSQTELRAQGFPSRFSGPIGDGSSGSGFREAGDGGSSVRSPIAARGAPTFAPRSKLNLGVAGVGVRAVATVGLGVRVGLDKAGMGWSGAVIGSTAGVDEGQDSDDDRTARL